MKGAAIIGSLSLSRWGLVFYVSLKAYFSFPFLQI